jgi:hypothetical protein
MAYDALVRDTEELACAFGWPWAMHFSGPLFACPYCTAETARLTSASLLQKAGQPSQPPAQEARLRGVADHNLDVMPNAVGQHLAVHVR